MEEARDCGRCHEYGGKGGRNVSDEFCSPKGTHILLRDIRGRHSAESSQEGGRRSGSLPQSGWPFPGLAGGWVDKNQPGWSAGRMGFLG